MSWAMLSNNQLKGVLEQETETPQRRKLQQRGVGVQAAGCLYAG